MNTRGRPCSHNFTRLSPQRYRRGMQGRSPGGLQIILLKFTHISQALFGYVACEPPSMVQTSGGGMFVPKDPTRDLKELAMAPLPSAPTGMRLSSHWLSIEGVQPAIPQVVAPTLLSIHFHMKGLVALPLPSFRCRRILRKPGLTRNPPHPPRIRRTARRHALGASLSRNPSPRQEERTRIRSPRSTVFILTRSFRLSGARTSTRWSSLSSPSGQRCVQTLLFSNLCPWDRIARCSGQFHTYPW